MTLVYRSTLLSLLVQFLVRLTSAAGLFLPLPPTEESGLRTIFALELSSQIVEFLWYISVVVWFKRIVTWTRYIDWVLSTPLMLISLAMFFHLRRGHPVEDVFAHGDIWITLAFNQLMLTCGLQRPLTGVTASADSALASSPSWTLPLTPIFARALASGAKPSIDLEEK